MIHLATTVCVYEHVCSEPYFVSKFAYQFEIVNSCFVISNNICKMSSVEFRKHFQPLRCELYSHPGFLVFFVFGHLSILRYQSGRNRSYFQYTLQNEIHPASDMPTALAISRMVYLPSLLNVCLTFGTFALPVTVTGRPDFMLHS